jgi:orotate phosphoribosyltransferase/AMMECR1 domain-containing protein
MLREPLSTTLASLAEPFHSDRIELLHMLRSRGILHRSPTQPILSRDGSSARWMLDTLAVTLSARGAELAGRCLLQLLKRFEGRQLATYGLTAVPILQSCILQDNRYRGLLVRKERKQHGSLKLIEGVVDPAEPVVLIDDSVSSGMSMEEATERLEEAGLRVEGGVCLVRFGWYGGYARMQERGYHMAALYDIWDDFISEMEGEDKPLANPSKWFPAFKWHTQSAPERLHPAQLARVVISEYLSSGLLLRAPSSLDEDYDSAGGAWVSLRSRTNIHQRFARGGFWHFPPETPVSTAEDVVLASLSTAEQLPKAEEGLKLVEQSAFAVTFFSELERCTPGELDNDRYGIVVRSLERREKMGGALPRMPGIRNEWHQFQHARIKNGQLVSFEPYELFRHEVVKAIEPDASWQPSGVPLTKELPWHKDKNVCGRIAEWARDFVLARLFDRSPTTAELGSDLLPENVDSCYVTVYLDGQLRGCMGTKIHNLDDDLKTTVDAALGDERFESHAATDADAVAVTVSLLFDSLVIGQATPEEIVNYYRHGEQTLMAFQEQQVGLLLPFVACTWNLDPVSFAKAVLEKAKLTEPPYNWCRFDCTTWLANSEGVWSTVGGFPSHCVDALADDLVDRHIALHKRYLLQHLRTDGTFYSRYQPFHNRLFEGIEPSRQAYGAWVLARAAASLGGRDLKQASTAVIESVMSFEHEHESVAELSFLLLTLCTLPANDPRRSSITSLAARLWNCIELPHGRILTHNEPEPAPEAFQDYFPGQVLLALATACEENATEIDSERLDRSFRYYCHRFRYKRHFGQVTWLLQSFGKWWQVTKVKAFADFVFEVADWLLSYQQEKTGAFINDHQPETPGYTTAVYLEGIAAAMQVAKGVGDHTRYQTYERAFNNGVSFLDRLIIQTRDNAILPNPEFAIGGLRQGLYYGEIRTDFVQHSLSALLEYRAQQVLAV